MSNEADEKVLCVPAIWAKTVLGYEGLRVADKLSPLLDQKTYRNRKTPNDGDPPVEQDERWKQLIPYIAVVNSKGQILAYNRGSKGGEKRLENLWAIGVGGHVNDQDAAFDRGIIREIREELSGPHVDVLGWDCLEDDDDGKAGMIFGPIGFLNDDSDDVGRKHLGVVYVLRADDVTPKENPEWYWMGLDVLCLWAERGYLAEGSTNKLESWARLALPMVRAWMESN